MLMHHPAPPVLIAGVAIVGMSIAFGRIFDQGEDFEPYKGQVVITESQMAFGDTKSGNTIAVMGTITNTSSVPWKEIEFHADFVDAAGRRTDVGEKREAWVRLSPNASSSFKASFRREFAETNYARHTIRVVGAKDARARW